MRRVVELVLTLLYFALMLMAVTGYLLGRTIGAFVGGVRKGWREGVDL